MPDRNATPNTLIAAMDEETAWAVLDASERVDLDIRYRLQAPNTPNDYVYFPESGVTSMVAHARGGLKIETGIIGKEGMVTCSTIAIGYSKDEEAEIISASLTEQPHSSPKKSSSSRLNSTTRYFRRHLYFRFKHCHSGGVSGPQSNDGVTDSARPDHIVRTLPIWPHQSRPISFAIDGKNHNCHADWNCDLGSCDPLCR